MISGAWMICFGVAALLVGLAYRVARKPCSHMWKTDATFDVLYQGKALPQHIDYVLRCEHCGEIQKRRI